MKRWIPIVLAAAAAASVLAPHNAAARDLDYERLADSLARLASDPKLGSLAPTQLDRARASLAQLKEAGRKERPHLIYVTERRIEIARVTAETQLLEGKRVSLQRENDRLQLEAARRDAAQARRELEQERLQAQIRAEEAERLAREAEAARLEGEQANQAAEAARAEAAQSKRIADAQARAAALAKKEAELASAVAGGSGGKPAESAPAPAKRRMSLADKAFVSGQATLADTARIAKIVDFVNADPARRIRIEASAGTDRDLARQRAEAVRDALVAAGVAADRITASGVRAKGRQVDITLED